jgi:hypothetical protein
MRIALAITPDSSVLPQNSFIAADLALRARALVHLVDVVLQRLPATRALDPTDVLWQARASRAPGRSAPGAAQRQGTAGPR